MYYSNNNNNNINNTSTITCDEQCNLASLRLILNNLSYILILLQNDDVKLFHGCTLQ